MLTGALVLLLTTATACSSTGTTATGGGPAAAGPSTTSAPPRPARTPAEDSAAVSEALVTAGDLGKPWVRPKTVSRAAKEGEVCPGHLSAIGKVRFTASGSTDLTEGKGAGKNIASYRLQVLPDEDAAAVVAAVQTDQEACGRYQDASGFSVVRTAEGPPTVAGAEVLAGWAERVSYVRPARLAYARHYLMARQGRVVTTVSYAFVAGRKDPEAKDFAKASRLLGVQLDKNARVFPP